MDYEATAARHLWIHESSRAELFDGDMLRIFRRGEGAWLVDGHDDRYLDLCSSMWQAALGHGRHDIVAAYAEQADAIASAGPISSRRKVRSSSPSESHGRHQATSRGCSSRARAPKPPRPRSSSPASTTGFAASRTGTSSSRATARTTGPGWAGRRSGAAAARPALLPAATGHGQHRPAHGDERHRGRRGPPNRDRDGGAGDGRGVHRRTSRDHAVHDPGRRLLATRPRDLRRIRRPDDRRRDAHRLLPDRSFWGIQRWGVTPDVLVAAKAVSSGYAPVAAMIVREHVYEAFGNDVPSPSVQSYGGHGASAAAGARAFEVYETERMDEVQRGERSRCSWATMTCDPGLRPARALRGVLVLCRARASRSARSTVPRPGGRSRWRAGRRPSARRRRPRAL